MGQYSINWARARLLNYQIRPSTESEVMWTSRGPPIGNLSSLCPMVIWLFAVCRRVFDCRACDPLDPECVDGCIPQFDGGPESSFGELACFQKPSEPIRITAFSYRKFLVYQHHNWRLCKCARETDVPRHVLVALSWFLLKITRMLCTMSVRKGMLPTSLRHVISAGTSSSLYSPCRPFLLVASSSSSLFLPRPALS